MVSQMAKKRKLRQGEKINMAHISIEGMDGVGKTTTCKLLAQKLGYKFIEKNLQELFDEDDSMANYIRIRDKVNRSDDRLFTALFYALANTYLYTKHGEENIITDRHILSNYCWSGTKDNEEVYQLLLNKLPKPSLTVILYASEQVNLLRLKNRDENDMDLWKVNESKNCYKKMIDFCDNNKIKYMLIDTSNLTLDQTVEQIMTRIEYNN